MILLRIEKWSDILFFLISTPAIDVDMSQQHFSLPERRSSKDVIFGEFSKNSKQIQNKFSQTYTPSKVWSKVCQLYGSPSKSDKLAYNLPSYLQPKRVTSCELTTEDEVLLYAKCKHLLKPGVNRELGVNFTIWMDISWIHIFIF